MNNDVWPPKEPVCTTAAPGTSRSASSTVWIPCARRSTPRSTVTAAGTPAADRGNRVAVTTTGFSTTVSGPWAARPPDVASEASRLTRSNRVWRISASGSGQVPTQRDHLRATIERLDRDGPGKHPLHRLPRQHVRGRPAGDGPAFGENQDLVGEACRQVDVVRDHERREPAPVHEGAHQLEQLHLVPQVERRRGLVEHEELGFLSEGAGEPNAL